MLGKSNEFYKLLTVLGAPAGAFLFRPKTSFWILGKSIVFYKLLTFLGAPVGAFFSANKSVLIVRGVLVSIYVIKSQFYVDYWEILGTLGIG